MKEMQSLEHFLKDVFLFRQWPQQDLERVTKHVKLQKNKKNDILFLHNEHCKFLYVLLRGQIQMFLDSEDGRQTTLHMLNPGSLVACAALFLGKAYPASARVMSDEAELLAIEGEAFLKLLAERPDLSYRMIASLASRIGELASRLESQSSENAERRLAQYLIELPSQPTKSGQRVIHLASSKKSIAAGLGMTPETFSRSLKKLAEVQAIAVTGKTISVINTSQLEAAASGH